jgi:hypothetical protein
MAHDEEQEGHSAVKQKPVDSLKNTHLAFLAMIFGWWRPAWFLSFEGRVGNVVVSESDRSRSLSHATAYDA